MKITDQTEKDKPIENGNLFLIDLKMTVMIAKGGKIQREDIQRGISHSKRLEYRAISTDNKRSGQKKEKRRTDDFLSSVWYSQTPEKQKENLDFTTQRRATSSSLIVPLAHRLEPMPISDLLV